MRCIPLAGPNNEEVERLEDLAAPAVRHLLRRRCAATPTILEAVQLVLQAGAFGRGGELFMLDMGGR